MKILAPCKINLFLEVKNRRPDGYHNIESIMQAVSLFDILSFNKAKSAITLKCNIKGLPVDDRNLVSKAARLLKEELGVSSGAKIYLEKNIPMGAGLGGGSSDAAATLIGLLRLWKKKLSAKKLIEIASRIGADVPFFINKGTSFAAGIGNIIKPLKKVKKSYFVIVFPGFGISTPSVYRKISFPLTKKRKITKIKGLLEASKGHDFWDKYLFNRLEESVIPDYPEIVKIKSVITDAGYRCLMSGSGSTVFGVVPSLEVGKKLKRKLLPYKWKVWVVKSL